MDSWHEKHRLSIKTGHFMDTSLFVEIQIVIFVD